MAESARITFRVPEATRQAWETEAALEGRLLSDWLRRMVERGREHRERETHG